MQTTYHPRSVCRLPSWSTVENFDSHHSGVVGNGRSNNDLNDEFLEDILDRVRYFAEACDSPSAINCIVDLQGGFGGLACSVVERIREDFGGSVCVPIWAITEEPGVRPRSAQPAGKQEILQRLDIPLSYNGLMEHASVFIPLDSNFAVSTLLGVEANKHNASMVLALAIEAASSFHLSVGNSVSNDNIKQNSPAEWVSDATNGGRFPLCVLEAYLSGLSRDVGSNITNNEFVLNSFKVAGDTKDSTFTTVNPFANSFSPAYFGPWSLSAQQNTAVGCCHKPFSNLLSIRGDFCAGGC